ncbi:MAG: peroxide stress protein YaaA [Lachnospiraceae bacterium]|nr:peroxide stress protein YaaA [Lachnospiraceae bacterium]
MRIIISPAKKMNTDTDSLDVRGLPCFMTRTERLLSVLKDMDYDELKKLWKCNDSIAKLNLDRLKRMELKKGLTPAILSYEGIQYQYMAPGVFTEKEYEYAQEHLRILSGFYGMLKPFDGVTPYRLEMQAKLKADGKKDLYDYWGKDIAQMLFSETDCIINLASKEYSLCVSKYLPEGIRFITCVFGEEKDRKIVEKGTKCKMARGDMVRFMAQNNITDPDEVKSYCGLNYSFSEKYSDENTYTFIEK